MSVSAFCNTEPTCMPLFGHFIVIERRVLVCQTERYQLTNEVCIRCQTKTVVPFWQYRADWFLSGHFMDILGRVLVHQT